MCFILFFYFYFVYYYPRCLRTCPRDISAEEACISLVLQKDTIENNFFLDIEYLFTKLIMNTTTRDTLLHKSLSTIFVCLIRCLFAFLKRIFHSLFFQKMKNFSFCGALCFKDLKYFKRPKDFRKT